MIKISYILTYILVCIFSATSLSCIVTETNGIATNISSKNNNQEANVIFSSLELPQGDEITLSAKVVNPRQIAVTIENKSSDIVFIPSIAGGSLGNSFIHSFEIEKQDLSSKEWVNIAFDDKVSRWISVWKPKEIATLNISLEKAGIYRVSVEYYLDKSLIEKFNSGFCLDKHDRDKSCDEIEKKMEIARKQLKTPPINLMPN